MNQLSQGLGIEEGYPTHADVLNTRGEPEILDGTCHRSQIHIRHGSPPENMPFPIVAKRGDQQFATIEDALHLEAHELVLALGHCLGRLEPFRLHESVNARPEPRITHPDETPGLHQPDARRHMRRTQQATHQRIVEPIGQEMPHVAPHGHYAVYGRDFLWRKITHVCFASPQMALPATRRCRCVQSVFHPVLLILDLLRNERAPIQRDTESAAPYFPAW